RELIGSDLIGHPATGTHNHLLSFPRHPKAWGLECASDVLANRDLAMQSRHVWRHQGGIVGPVRDCSLEVLRGGGRSPRLIPREDRTTFSFKIHRGGTASEEEGRDGEQIQHQ